MNIVIYYDYKPEILFYIETVGCIKVLKLQAVEKVPFKGVFQPALPPHKAEVVDEMVI